jgi:uncharacterized protein involved in exopolysaccharide biosynthesis
MSDKEFTPFDIIENTLSRWWIVVAVTVLGGIIGWTFHFLYSPVYQATAILTVTMDFPKGELSQYDKDYAFSAAGVVIDSADVKEQAIKEAQAQGITFSSPPLKNQMVSEGKQSVWELHVRDRDPQTAAKIANIWAQVANNSLNTALEDAVNADQILNQIYMLETCLPVTPGGIGSTVKNRPTPKECGRYSLTEIQTTIQSWANEFVKEREQSYGILSIMEFSLSSQASAPDEPVIYDQASLTLAGALIGFIASLWLAGLRRVRYRG